MNYLTKTFSTLGSIAMLAVIAPAQHQHYDKAIPPAKGEAGATEESTADRPPTTLKNDQLTSSATRFKALDTDRDNRISRAEFTLAPNLGLQTGDAIGEDAAKMRRSGRPSTGKEAVGVTDSNITTPSSSPVALFNEIDTDKDGFISPTELALHTGEPQSEATQSK